MSMRQPRQVIVFPFRITAAGPEYAVFRRSDDGCWQGVEGGAEDSEDLVTAARRETAEESGLAGGSPLYRPGMVSGARRTCFAASPRWPAGLYIVTRHFFTMDVTGAPAPAVLSREHAEFRWLPYGEASAILRYDDDKTALWELNARILARDLPPATG